MNPTSKVSGLISIRDHHFYANLINSDSIIVDLGSHVGQFSSEISEIFSCRCYAVEAMPSLCDRIIETPLIKKFNYAISPENKPVTFCITENPEGNHIERGLEDNFLEKITVEGISLENFLTTRQLERVDLLKVDIEGAEIEMFNSLSNETLCKIKQITVEFHDFKFPIHKQVEAIKRRLKALRFICVVYSRANHGDVLFINQKLCTLHFVNSIYIQYISKYILGASRVIKRTLSH